MSLEDMKPKHEYPKTTFSEGVIASGDVDSIAESYDDANHILDALMIAQKISPERRVVIDQEAREYFGVE